MKLKCFDWRWFEVLFVILLIISMNYELNLKCKVLIRYGEIY